MEFDAQRMENGMMISPGPYDEFDLTGHACVVTGGRAGHRRRRSANAGQSTYAAAKAGLATLTLTLAAELSRYGVCANAIASRARTPMSEAAFDTLPGGAGALPPDRVAALVAWIAGPSSENVTGQVFAVAGDTVRGMRSVRKAGRRARRVAGR